MQDDNGSLDGNLVDFITGFNNDYSDAHDDQDADYRVPIDPDISADKYEYLAEDDELYEADEAEPTPVRRSAHRHPGHIEVCQCCDKSALT